MPITQWKKACKVSEYCQPPVVEMAEMGRIVVLFPSRLMVDIFETGTCPSHKLSFHATLTEKYSMFWFENPWMLFFNSYLFPFTYVGNHFFYTMTVISSQLAPLFSASTPGVVHHNYYGVIWNAQVFHAACSWRWFMFSGYLCYLWKMEYTPVLHLNNWRAGASAQDRKRTFGL